MVVVNYPLNMLSIATNANLWGHFYINSIQTVLKPASSTQTKPKHATTIESNSQHKCHYSSPQKKTLIQTRSPNMLIGSDEHTDQKKNIKL